MFSRFENLEPISFLVERKIEISRSQGARERLCRVSFSSDVYRSDYFIFVQLQVGRDEITSQCRSIFILHDDPKGEMFLCGSVCCSPDDNLSLSLSVSVSLSLYRKSLGDKLSDSATRDTVKRRMGNPVLSDCPLIILFDRSPRPISIYFISFRCGDTDFVSFFEEQTSVRGLSANYSDRKKNDHRLRAAREIFVK